MMGTKAIRISDEAYNLIINSGHDGWAVSDKLDVLLGLVENPSKRTNKRLKLYGFHLIAENEYKTYDLQELGVDLKKFNHARWTWNSRNKSSRFNIRFFKNIGNRYITVTKVRLD